MGHFEFEHPLYFLLLLLIICIYKCPVSIKKIIFPHTEFFENVIKVINKDKLLYSLIIALMATALAKPITYDQKSQNKNKGRDLVFVLDTSGSMNESGYDEENKQKGKFEILKEILKDFIKKRYDDNIGVVIFGTFAYTALPITYDTKAVSFLLDFFDVGIAGNSTAIGDGLYEAIKSLKKSKAKNKVIILLTDGHNNSGSHSIKEEAKIAKKMGIKIYTIGIGTDYDKALLEKISKESGAKSFEAKDAKTLREIYSEIDSLEPSSIKSRNYLNKHELFEYPLILALVLLFYIVYKRKEVAF